MLNILILLPILIPLTAAIVALLLWNQRGLQRVVSVTGSAAHLAAAAVPGEVWLPAMHTSGSTTAACHPRWPTWADPRSPQPVHSGTCASSGMKPSRACPT